MIESMTPSAAGSVQIVPGADPDFRVEPQSQVSFLAPSVEVTRSSHGTDINVSQTIQRDPTEATKSTLTEMVNSARKGIDRYPSSARARVAFGMALLNSGDIEAAVGQFERAFELDGESSLAISHLARARLLQGDFTDAARLALRLIENDSKSSMGLLIVASAAAAQGNFEEAESRLKSARELDGRTGVPDYLLGMLFIRENRSTEAIASLRSAVRSQPRSAAMQHALGVAFGVKGELRKASQTLRTALTLDPRSRQSLIALARVLLRRNMAEEAVSELSRRITVFEKDREVQELLASGYHELTEHKAARRHLLVALELTSDAAPEDVGARGRITNNLGVCAARLREPEDAADWFARSLRYVPAPMTFCNLAITYRGLGKIALARGVLDNVLNRWPSNIEARVLASVMDAQLGHHEAALERLAGVVAEGNSPPEAYACFGGMLSDQGRDYGAAERVLGEGEHKFPEDVAIANNLAYVRLMTGDVEGARSVLTKVSISEIHESVFLTATMGLLRLHEGKVELAASLYSEAEKLAYARGDRSLGKAVRQKMHLEFARSYLKAADWAKVTTHVRKGLDTVGRATFRDELESFQKLIPSSNDRADNEVQKS